MSKKAETIQPVTVTQRDVDIALARARQMRAEAMRRLGAALWQRLRAPFVHGKSAGHGRATRRHA